MVMTPPRRVEQRLRSLRPWLVAACAAAPWFAAACAGRSDDLKNPGRSDAFVPPRPQASASTSSPAMWDQASVLASFDVIDDRTLPSRGHNPPYWSGEVRANAAIASIYRDIGPDSVIPEASVVAEEHRGSDGGDGPTFAMVKRAAGFDDPGGNWEYFVVRRDGTIDSRGVLPLCARCHADAPYDHLFGPRVSSRRRIGDTDAGLAETDGSFGTREDDEGLAPSDSELPGQGTKPGTKPSGKKRRSH